MDVRVGLWKKLGAEELMLLNCGVGEDSGESPGQQRDQTMTGFLKEINPEYSLEGPMLKLKLKLWPLDAKSWLIRKDSDAAEYWKKEEKGTTEDDMVEWHHWLNGHEFEQALQDGDGQGSLTCCMQSMGSQRVRHEWTTEQQQQSNWNFTKIKQAWRR